MRPQHGGLYRIVAMDRWCVFNFTYELEMELAVSTETYSRP